MSVAPYWREPHDHRWSVAQIHASLDDIVRVILAEGDHRAVPLLGAESPYEVAAELMVPIVLYRQSNSDWSFIEGLYGVIGCDVQRVSSELNADVLIAEFEDSVGLRYCALFRNGKLLKQYDSGPSEFMNPNSDCYDNRSCDGIERTWQTNPPFTRRLYDTTGVAVDLENTSFDNYWNAVSVDLNLDIPPLCWDHDPRRSTISADPALTDVLHESARLFDTGTG